MENRHESCGFYEWHAKYGRPRIPRKIVTTYLVFLFTKNTKTHFWRRPDLIIDSSHQEYLPGVQEFCDTCYLEITLIVLYIKHGGRQSCMPLEAQAAATRKTQRNLTSYLSPRINIRKHLVKLRLMSDDWNVRLFKMKNYN